MGQSSYSLNSRSIRATTSGFYTKPVDEVFEQNKKKEIHDLMDPKGIRLREARDSSIHPATKPIVLGLDVTGSMGRIPHYLVKDGLPHLMGTIIENGVPDAALMLIAVGDGLKDNYPLQVSQFESGDAELDNWLTKTYIEGGGGGNGGESYSLVWYFAANHTITDSWEKRKEKGLLFTVGDEPCHKELTRGELSRIMGSATENNFTDKQLLEAAQKTWDVYHLHILQGSDGMNSLHYWKELLGDHCISVSDYKDVSKVIADIVVKNTKKIATVAAPSLATPTSISNSDTKKEESML